PGRSSERFFEKFDCAKPRSRARAVPRGPVPGGNTVPRLSRREEAFGVREVLGGIDLAPRDPRHVGSGDGEPVPDQPRIHVLVIEARFARVPRSIEPVEDAASAFRRKKLDADALAATLRE